MNPLQAFLIPPQTTLQNQISQKSVAQSDKTNNSKKIKLTSSSQNNQDLSLQILIRAINNSSTQRLSGDKTQLDPNDLISIISQFALQQSIFKNQDISNRKWCIVQVDQQYLRNKNIGKIGNLFQCSSHCDHHQANQQRHEYNIINHIQLPSTLRPYCLILNMAQRQLHFQSHQSPNNNFFINFDTIQTYLQKQEPYNIQLAYHDKQYANRILNQPIQLRVINKRQPMLICLYLTQFTLPFPFKQIAPESEKIKYLLSYRKSLYNLLENSIKQSRGNKLKLNKILDLAVSNSKKFYNSRYATEQQFVNYCESGDLILFRDNHTMAKVQRVVTSSPYDHVAVVYKTEQLGICLFQSSSALGVGLASWRKLIRSRWFQNIDKIAWRKLQIHNKPANFQQKMDEFIKGNLHKQFGLNLNKLLKFKSVTYSKDSHKSYFCSELVAELYRFLGLLDSQKSSSQYWPKDFADGNGIQILNGALDFERQIIFEDPLLKQCYPFFR